MTTSRRGFIGTLMAALVAGPSALQALVAPRRPTVGMTGDYLRRMTAGEDLKAGELVTLREGRAFGPSLDVHKAATPRTVTIEYAAIGDVDVSVDGGRFIRNPSIGRLDIPRPSFGDRDRFVEIRARRGGQHITKSLMVPPGYEPRRIR